MSRKLRGDRPVAPENNRLNYGRVVEAERMGDGRDRQVGLDEIAPRLAKAAEFLPARTAGFEFGPEVPLLINVDQRSRRSDLPERG